MPRKRSEPKAMNSAGRPVSPLTGAPPVMRKTTPRTRTMVPRVVMKGWTLRTAMTSPLASPTAAPAMTPAATPAAIPASSMTMLAMQPDSAAVEPTERSKPPPTMTNVMPMAITAMIEDCTRMLVRLKGERKRLVSHAFAAHITMSEISRTLPARFHRRGARFILTADRIVQRRLVQACGAIERSRNPPLPHGENTVAQARELAQIAGMDQRAAAARDDIADERVDLQLGRDIDALGGLIEQEHGNPPRQPFRQDHLLLIAAGERTCLELGATRTDIDELHHLGDDAIAGVAVEPAEARQRIEIGQQDVVAHRLIHDEAERAFARHHADAGCDSIGGTCEPALAAARLDHRRLAPGTEQGANHPIGAAAEEACQADDLALAHAHGGNPVRLRVEHRFPGGERSGDRLLRQASDHGADQVVHREGAAGGNRRHPPVAQHGAAVGDGDHLVETVGNVDDGGALPLHARQHRKQARDLAFFERRRRLVEDEDAAPPAQRLGDRHELTLGEAERSDARP